MNLPLNKAFGPWFEAADVVRRAQGEGLAMLGFGPAERGHRVIAMSPLWRLRRYAGSEGGSSVLIVAAPIKRAYIWDLAPSVSAVRYCLGHGLRLHLLEWVPPTPLLARCGLAEYAFDAISKAVAAAADEDGGAKPLLMGHSLGGTLATVFAALHPESLSGLVLLSAPLCFAPGSSAFRDAIDEIAPPASITPFLEATSEVDTRLIVYPGEPGVVLQHLGILVGRSAYASIWPEIVSWVKDHSGSLGLDGKVAAAGSRT